MNFLETAMGVQFDDDADDKKEYHGTIQQYVILNP